MTPGKLTELAAAIRRRGLWCGWREAPALGAVLVSGADCATFLQAQLTSDVLGLAPGAGQLSARLNRRGQLRAWFSLHRLPERGQPYPTYLCLLPEALAADLVADLTDFIISEDVLLEDVSDTFTGWVAQWPADREAGDGLAAAVCGTADPGDTNGIEANGLAIRRVASGGEVWLIRRALTGDPGWVVLAPEGPDASRVADAGAEFASGQDWVRFDPDEPTAAARVWSWLTAESGWPRVGADLEPGTRVLAQTGLELQLASFSKGCYLGQEVVARIRTYGSVPEALRALVWRDVAPEEMDTELPAAGVPCLDSAGKRCGTFGAAFWSPVLQMAASLVFLGRADRRPGMELSVSGPLGTLCGEVNLLPVHQGVNAAERAAQLHDRALREFAAGRDQEAVGLLEETLRLDPSRAEAWEALGVILGRLERYHEAIDIFRRLAEVAPDEPMVHTNLSLFYMKIGDKEEAERHKALGTMKRFGVGSDPAEAAALAEQERVRRLADAERKRTMFAEVLALDPDDPLALMGMGQALVELEEPTAAIGFLSRALVRQDQNSALYASYGRVLAAAGRPDEAADVFRRGIDVASRRGDLMPLKEMEHRLQLLGGGPDGA